MSRHDVITLLYIVAFSLFIVGLHMLRGPRTAVRGNQVAAVGMAIAIVATLIDQRIDDWGLIVVGLVIGTAVGVPSARSVQMTAMPQMVALFNGVGGGAVALISVVEYREALEDGGMQPGARGPDPDPVRGDHRLDLLLGLDHRLPQAPGVAQARLPDPAPGQRRARRLRRRDRGRDRRRHRVGGAVLAAAADLGPARPVRGAADRRRRHAGRDLDPQRLHRPQRRGRRPRARQHRADRGRHARRRLRLDPHQADGRGDEPLDRQRLLQRPRGGRADRRGGRGRHGALDERRRRRDPALLRAPRRGRAGLRHGGRPGPARGRRPRRRAREAAASRCSTASIPSPGACRAT